MTNGAEKEYVTFRELVSREEKMLEKFEVILNKHFGLFEKDINNRFVSYGHDIAEELQTMRKSILSELRDDGAENKKDVEEPSKSTLVDEMKAGIRGKGGAQGFVISFLLFAILIALILINPNVRHVLPFIPF